MMNDKLKLLKSILGTYHKEGSEQFLFHCPFCPLDKQEKRKLSVNFKKGLYKCWICEVYGNIYNLVLKIGDRNDLSEWRKLSGIFDHSEEKFDPFKIHKKIKKINNFKLPEEFETLTINKENFFLAQPKAYLKNRGITEKDILLWKIGYCRKGDYSGRIVIPSFDVNGKVNYFVSRTYMNDWKKYINPEKEQDFIFNELYLNFGKPLIVVEGVFDAIKAGENSVPLLGSSLSEKGELFKKIVRNNTPIYLALDPDIREKENRIIKNLLEYDVEVFKIEVRPFDDVGEMSKNEFLQRKNEARKINHNNLIKYNFLA